MKRFLAFEYLEVFACLCVCFGHVVVFNVDSVPYLKEIGKHITYLTYDTVVKLSLIKYVNLGQLGVSFFFLISGFFIMHSRASKTTVAYLYSRIFRIFPIAIASVVICYVSVEVLNKIFFALPMDFSFQIMRKVITNAFLINDFFFEAAIVPVFWFLLVTVKFYAIMLISKKYSQKDILILALSLLIVVLGYISFGSKLEQKGLYTCFGLLRMFAFNAHHIIYILIGSSLYLIFKNYVFFNEKLTINKDIIYTIVICLLFTISYKALRDVDLLPTGMLKNYGISIVLFIGTILIIHKVTFTIKPICFLSSISYPIYTIHYTFGAFYVFFLGKISFMRENLFIMYSTVFLLIFLTAFLLNLGVKYSTKKILHKVRNKRMLIFRTEEDRHK